MRAGRQAIARGVREPRRPRGAEAQGPRPPDDRPALRLALSRGLLTIELDAPFRLGPISVAELGVALPDVKFPVDLSGGVAKFRHRRGLLEKLAIEARAVDLATWGAPKLVGLLGGEQAPGLVVAPFEDGALIGIRLGASALAFDVLVAPLDGDLRFIPERARGIGLAAPPHALAMRAIAALLGRAAEIVGGAVVVRDAASRLARELMPAAGARAPAALDVRFGSLTSELTRASLEASAGAPPPALSERAIRALETSELTGDADRLLVEGDLDGARAILLVALERAPRHVEIAQRIAWIDRISGGRAEGALATLTEVLPASFSGVLGGELLDLVGDADGARSTLARAAHDEPFGGLAALTWLRAAALATELDERLEALDQANLRAPSLDLARWARLEARLDVADVRGARADVEHLEAAARGSSARHAVWARAAESFLARGLVAEASGLFERALRYAPDDPTALAGLARSLRAAGQHRRAVDLLARAAAIGERKGQRTPSIEIELARALAEAADDRPAAVARLRAIPIDAEERFEARFLEGRFRAELGDLAGAAIAFGRLRDAVELALGDLGVRAAHVAVLLADAARVEENELGDPLAAQRDLGLAMRLRPRDRLVLGASFRRASSALVAEDERERPRQLRRSSTSRRSSSSSTATSHSGPSTSGSASRPRIESCSITPRSSSPDRTRRRPRRSAWGSSPIASAAIPATPTRRSSSPRSSSASGATSSSSRSRRRGSRKATETSARTSRPSAAARSPAWRPPPAPKAARARPRSTKSSSVKRTAEALDAG